jgi:hypothetical protein
MKSSLKIKNRLTFTLHFLLPLLCGLLLLTHYYSTINAENLSNPLIIYYSRTGTTRIVAHELKNQLSCDLIEIKSTKFREGFFGAFTCVLDQLLDRDDLLAPFNRDLKMYNPVVIASPIWIHRLCSPTRAFIKEADLKGKEVYLFLTNNGNFSQEDQNEIIKVLTAQGIRVKGMYVICTEDKTGEELIEATRSFIPELRTSIF